MNDDAEILSELQKALTGDQDERGEAQDRLVEFVKARAADSTAIAPLMEMVENLDKVRRYYALDAVVCVALNAPKDSGLQKAALDRWGDLIERIAAENIFDALDWASHPGLFCDDQAPLHMTGVMKWSDLIDRAAVINPIHALAHAREMAGAEPWRPLTVMAQVSAELIESRMNRPPAGPLPPAPN
jgi:hypothetical protein